MCYFLNIYIYIMLTKNNILNILKYISINPTKRTYLGDKGRKHSVCYQAVVIDDIKLKGNRDCEQRLDIIKKNLDLNNKNIIDIGCNIGGMLFPISNIIKNGAGID